MEHLVTGTFETHLQAEQALRALDTIGVTDSQISVVVTDETRKGGFKIESGSKADEGFAAGATAGGIVGAVLGSLMAAGTIAIPGLNLIVTGTVIGSLAGLATGATAGGLVGALIGAGIPEHEAKLYEKNIRGGATLLAVKATDNDQKKLVESVFKKAGSFHLAA